MPPILAGRPSRWALAHILVGQVVTCITVVSVATREHRLFCHLFTSKRLGTGDIILVLQQNRLRWYVHVIQKEDTNWVKKCMEHEVEAPDQEVDQRGLGERLCRKIVKRVN